MERSNVCESVELKTFHFAFQIVVEVAEESRFCRFGEKIRKYDFIWTYLSSVFVKLLA